MNGQQELKARHDDAPAGDANRLADCTNYLEDEDRPCTGTLHFGPHDLQAACRSCGAWCGRLVANYRQPEPKAARTDQTGSVK